MVTTVVTKMLDTKVLDAKIFTTSASLGNRIGAFVTTDLDGTVRRVRGSFGRACPSIRVLCGTSDSNALRARVRRNTHYSVFFSTTSGRVSTLMSRSLTGGSAMRSVLRGGIILVGPGSKRAGIAKFRGVASTTGVTLTNSDIPIKRCSERVFSGLKVASRMGGVRVGRNGGMSRILTTMDRKDGRVNVICTASTTSITSGMSIVTRTPTSTLGAPILCPMNLVRSGRTSRSSATTTRTFLRCVGSSSTVGMFRGCKFATCGTSSTSRASSGSTRTARRTSSARAGTRARAARRTGWR